MCDKEKLRQDTEEYWECRNGWEYYIKELLPREMECAALEAKERLPEHSCERLVFLVGHSLEPLFQSVWAYKPKRVLLILSSHYAGENERIEEGSIRGREVKRLIEGTLLPGTGIHVDCRVVNDTSEDIFRCLRQEVREDATQVRDDGTLPVVIDITGAKKSMVAGAFTFAAYTNVPVSYVDFDNDAYDPKAGRPFGYACRIAEVKNPYRLFALRDWERVKTLYERYNFRGARRGLEEVILPAMRDSFSDSEIDNAGSLIEVLRCYELWDNGDFCTANERSRAMPGFRQPTAVDRLGVKGFWPCGDTFKQLKDGLERIEFGDGESEGARSLYLQPELLMIYARDEAAKVERLIEFNEDFRSALLRAVGLWEVLMRARVVGLWEANLMDIDTDPNGSYPNRKDAPPIVKQWEKEIYRALIQTMSGNVIIQGLRYDNEQKYRRKRHNLKWPSEVKKSSKELPTFYLRRSLSAPRLKEEVVVSHTELRDKAIHTYLSVPKGIAQETIGIARKNLDDYEEVWIPKIYSDYSSPSVNVSQLPWSEVCELCRLDFLPPNLQRD